MGMLYWSGDNYIRERQAAVTARLKRLGINPRSNKYHTLFHRWMNSN